MGERPGLRLPFRGLSLRPLSNRTAYRRRRTPSGVLQAVPGMRWRRPCTRFCGQGVWRVRPAHMARARSCLPFPVVAQSHRAHAPCFGELFLLRRNRRSQHRGCRVQPGDSVRHQCSRRVLLLRLRQQHPYSAPLVATFLAVRADECEQHGDPKGGTPSSVGRAAHLHRGLSLTQQTR
jgi:hypothetical protein